MHTRIRATYSPEADIPKAPAERAWLYRPDRAWTYSHHPFLAHFDGRYVAMWSNGREDEDAPGQRVLMATSPDFRTWSEPAPLVDSMMGEKTELVLTPAGFHQHQGTLGAYVGQYEYTPDVLDHGRRPKAPVGFRNAKLWAITARDLGTWGDPIDLGLPMVPNQGPEPTRSGRLLISGNVWFPHTDDPAGLSGWSIAGICPAELIDDFADHQQGWHEAQEAAGWPAGLCEGSWYQTDDGVVHTLLRSGTERLWVTESADDGETWSEPRPTGFPNARSKFHCGRLPDGRFYVVGNPDPRSAWPRNPLVLSLSDDGRSFDRHVILADEHREMAAPGMHKGGDYGYPHTLIHDSHLCVIVSRQKEAVEALRIPLAELGE
ncbi:MAG: exo-alpha-sialidase [bacterium]